MAIGQRRKPTPETDPGNRPRKPTPEGKPGYLRIDTVPQGDLDGVKGVYYRNAVDEVTEWQVIGARSQIGETWLLPVLEAMLEQFPFHILSLHSDWVRVSAIAELVSSQVGVSIMLVARSEFINHTVAGLLNKLLVEQTKSRPGHCHDNGLVEAKNGAVIGKLMGYGHMAAEHAEAMGVFYKDDLNPYLNFPRPCGVPETIENAKGKQRRIYRWYARPWEILRQLADLARPLRPEVSVAGMERKANAQSDTQAATNMPAAKRKLFARMLRRRTAGARMEEGPPAPGLRPFGAPPRAPRGLRPCDLL
jgi:hypothetical protein